MRRFKYPRHIQFWNPKIGYTEFQFLLPILFRFTLKN
nr:MAG TPA: hypothetical protein [Bacteriophage sp.]